MNDSVCLFFQDIMNDYIMAAMNPSNVSLSELEEKVSRCSGFVKMMTGVANNCAYGIMMDCLDQLRKHPKYDKRLRKKFEGKANSVLSEYRQYRNRLRWPWNKDVAFFSLCDMPDAVRKKYGIISDAQYFEFWEATGSLAYQKSRSLATSLWNKFRLSLLKHDVPYSDIAAWGLVAASVLELSVEVWQRAMRSVQDAVPELLKKVIEDIYSPFSLSEVSKKWQTAFLTLCPESDGYHLDLIEEKNIAIGLNQLRELWISSDLPFDATIRAVEDYADEIFRTKGEAKKSIRELTVMRNAAIEDIEGQKRHISGSSSV